MHPADLERRLGHDLRHLPAPRAPQTLLPRVLAAVQGWSRRPWYAREWFTWPLAWQMVSIALLVLVVAGGVTVLPIVRVSVGGAIYTFTSRVMADASPIALGVDMTANTGRVLWRALVEPLLPYVFVLVGLMCLACATCAVALNRAVFGRVLHS